jgi:ATP-dependent DNA ligase
MAARQPTLPGLAIPPTLRPMEALLATELPDADGQWQFEPKWDGFRCLAFRAGNVVEIKAKSGKSLSRFFPEVLANFRTIPQSRFVLDGELVIAVGGVLSFDALQMRLHPAPSRIQRLAQETPATFVAFDCLLAEDGSSLLDAPLAQRRVALERFCKRAGDASGTALTPATHDVQIARQWLNEANVARDGVVAKRQDLPYQPGERAMRKVKLLHTVDCVVGGFRYDANRRHVASLLLGLYDAAGLLHHVGFTSGIADRDKPALTKRLEKLVAPPGFTGNAPGGPSRWSSARSTDWEPLRPHLVVEVRYDHRTGNRFRHGTKIARWRPDKPPHQCTFDQLPPAQSATGLFPR